MTTVLLIDDEPAMGRLVSGWLAELGARVVQAGNLSDALEKARLDPPKAVLLDLALEDEDGLEILPDLWREPALDEVPVIAFTVHDSREPEAREKGVSGFVSKPFRAQDLQDAIREHL